MMSPVKTGQIYSTPDLTCLSFLKFVLPLIGVVLLLGAAVAPDVLPPTVWRVHQGNSTAVPAPSREAVEAFIQVHVNSEARVCGWEFVDLNNDGVNELVVSLDYSGRKFCNPVVLISKAGDVFRTQSVWAWNVPNVSDIVKDLNNDGRLPPKGGSGICERARSELAVQERLSRLPCPTLQMTPQKGLNLRNRFFLGRKCNRIIRKNKAVTQA